MRPLSPLPQAAGGAFDDTTPLLPRRGNGGCRLRFRDGQTLQVKCIAHAATPLGLFTFTPINIEGDLLRSFYPQPMIAEVTHAGADADKTAGSTGGVAPPAVARKRAGDNLAMQPIATPEALRSAIEEQARMPVVRIGEALLALGSINKQQLSDALQGRSCTATCRWASCWCGLAASRPSSCTPRWRARWATRWSMWPSFRSSPPRRCACPPPLPGA
ncbi:hypothetical protein PEC18_19485 [Paucibacter sp. O1-1]|nr:hypothetical protein [Paucibacter sp. O1-1]MDA3827966.1 hypothetical protein [Paucibacter sp. O1-1]